MLPLKWDQIMLSATIKHMLARAATRLDAFGEDRRCAQRLERLGGRLQALGDRINLLRSYMVQELGEAIDCDHVLRNSLKGLKEDIREIRCQLAGLDAPRLSTRLQRAFVTLARIAEETYARADKLQWEIDEHDQRYV
jgi:hypothetical protein